MSRREKTERKILGALEGHIRETGVADVGVNSIKQDYWTGRAGTARAHESSTRTPDNLVLSKLPAQLNALRGNEALREIRRWKFIKSDDVTAQLADRRERSARAFIGRVDSLTREADVLRTSAPFLPGCCI